MFRSCVLVLAGLVGIGGPIQAADSPAGNWRTSLTLETERGQLNLSLLIMFTEADGKWAADFLDSAPNLGADATIEATVRDDSVKFVLKFGPNTWNFEGKVEPGAKKIKGSFELGRQVFVQELTKTTLKSLSKDRFAVARDALDNSESPAEFFAALTPVLSQAAANKMKPEEVRAYADKAAKLAEAYGLRWQRSITFRLAETLVDQEPYVAIAVEQARLGERMIARTDDIATQMQALDTVAKTLRRAKKDADATEVESRITKLEARDYLEYSRTMPPFKAEEFAGRKQKSDRVILVENFTGCESGPSVAVDLACDSLLRTYKPSEVILLSYHQHIPGPNPLVSKDGSDRLDYYAKNDEDKGTPTLVIAGKEDASGGGAQPKQAKVKYTAYRETIDPLLEKPSTAKVAVTASLKAGEITIKGTVSDLQKPGEKVSLRFALVEDRVRHTGGNGVRYHHAVVRSMPGGPKGFPLPKATAEQSVLVKLNDVKATNDKLMDDLISAIKRQGVNLSLVNKPIGTNLRVVAFVQNDETKEVLNAAQVELAP